MKFKDKCQYCGHAEHTKRDDCGRVERIGGEKHVCRCHTIDWRDSEMAQIMGAEDPAFLKSLHPQ